MKIFEWIYITFLLIASAFPIVKAVSPEYCQKLERMLNVVAHRNKQVQKVTPEQQQKNEQLRILLMEKKADAFALRRLQKRAVQGMREKYQALAPTAEQRLQLKKRVDAARAFLSLKSKLNAAQEERLKKLLLDQTFSQWVARCSTLKETFTPKGVNSPGYFAFTDKDFTQILSVAENKVMLKVFRDQYYNTMNKKGCWVGGAVSSQLAALHDESYKNTSDEMTPLMPYTQKLIIPDTSRVCFMGDIHGSVHALLRNLKTLNAFGYLDEKFKVIDRDGFPFYMIFLGDYVDRGAWSVEVLHTLMRLKIANPERVFLLKGNHEIYSLNDAYGFREELKIKYSQNNENLALMEMYNNVFEYLPCALYLGVQGTGTFIQCCHGGIEPFYNPKELITSKKEVLFDKIKTLDQTTKEKLAVLFARAFPKGLDYIEKGLGFTWSEFLVGGNRGLFPSTRGIECPGCSVQQGGAREILETLNGQIKDASIRAFFRGHQHNFFGLKFADEEKSWTGRKISWTGMGMILEAGGVESKDMDNKGFSVEDFGPVFTFSTAREGVELGCDCFGILSVGKTYNDFRLMPYEWKLTNDDLGLEEDFHTESRRQRPIN